MMAQNTLLLLPPAPYHQHRGNTLNYRQGRVFYFIWYEKFSSVPVGQTLHHLLRSQNLSNENKATSAGTYIDGSKVCSNIRMHIFESVLKSCAHILGTEQMLWLLVQAIYRGIIDPMCGNAFRRMEVRM